MERGEGAIDCIGIRFWGEVEELCVCVCVCVQKF